MSGHKTTDGGITGDGADPTRLERRYGVMKAHGNHVQDTEAVYLDHYEVQGDLRCRRRLVFPPAVAQATRAEPLVLLLVEAIEAEAAAAEEEGAQEEKAAAEAPVQAEADATGGAHAGGEAAGGADLGAE
ncbi:uncharacterized protein LOC120704648 [Panicum virgatum]|uniref:uncharacterized protein LOC120704648 n=1 Tax=Panicum virgatum TaxID=38727 RepID=UPI0019D69820|nr:uncharacterized protein LOC120704648 [Panicum virgatum]XP_039845053.1 uncharacterized protein LOC120704648 [Panicum virgatum]